MCIGKNVQLNATNVSQKCTLPSVLLNMRPNIFGYQCQSPAKIAKVLPPKST